MGVSIGVDMVVLYGAVPYYSFVLFTFDDDCDQQATNINQGYPYNMINRAPLHEKET